MIALFALITRFRQGDGGVHVVVDDEGLLSIRLHDNFSPPISGQRQARLRRDRFIMSTQPPFLFMPIIDHCILLLLSKCCI